MESPLKELRRHGQSPWLDLIQRRMVRSGELSGMIDDWGLCGITRFSKPFDALHDAIEDQRRAAAPGGGSAPRQPGAGVAKTRW